MASNWPDILICVGLGLIFIPSSLKPAILILLAFLVVRYTSLLHSKKSNEGLTKKTLLICVAKHCCAQGADPVGSVSEALHLKPGERS